MINSTYVAGVSGIDMNATVSAAQASDLAAQDAKTLDSAGRAPVVSAPTLVIHKFGSGKLDLSWKVVTTQVWLGPSHAVGIYFVDTHQASLIERTEGVKGFFWGNLVAIALALLILLVPVIEKPLVQLGVISYCLPIVAIGPILEVCFSGNQPKAILAAMACFFTTLIGMLVGLRSADPTSLDVIRAFGGSRYRALVKVRLKASLPSLFAALRIAAPAAVLGAIIGEYLGGTSGLGVAMINSEQSLNVARTWGIAFVATALAGVGYVVVALVGGGCSRRGRG